MDYDGSNPPPPVGASAKKKSDSGTTSATLRNESSTTSPDTNKDSGSQDKDDVFSDSEAEDGSSKGRRPKSGPNTDGSTVTAKGSEVNKSQAEATSVAQVIGQVSLKSEGEAKKSADHATNKTEGDPKKSGMPQSQALESSSMSEFKAIAADASVFSFGDEDEYESE